MRNYILSISICSIVGAFVYIAAPEYIKKYVSLLNAVILIVVLISPITKNKTLDFEMGQDRNGYETTQIDINKLAAESLARSISNTIEKDYNIQPLRVVVEVNENSSFDVNRVDVYINDKHIDKSKIADNVQKLYGCRIKLIYQE